MRDTHNILCRHIHVCRFYIYFMLIYYILFILLFLSVSLYNAEQAQQTDRAD